MRRSAIGQSCASPPVNRMAIRRPLTSASACIFVLRPPRERPTACFCSPLSPCRRAVGLDVRGVDHLRGSGSPAPSKLPEKVFPYAAPRPAHKAVIDRCRRTIFGRAIAPAAAAFEHMHDAADHTAVIHSFNASNIRRQVGFNPRPLFIAQPKQVPAHDPDPPSNSNQDRIVTTQELMSSDPSLFSLGHIRG